MSQLPSTRRTTSLSGSSRLSLSVGRGKEQSPAGIGSGRHPLKHEWSISYVHRPPGTKVDYEKEIKRVATFGSIESFLHLYSHLTPSDDLQPVTDILIFQSKIATPGTWECMPDGGKFSLRLVHPITPLLFESILFALIGEQFEEEDKVVGCVLSARQTEDLISVWVEEESEGLKNGALRERIINILNLPSGSSCEYRSNQALLTAAQMGSTTQSSHDKPSERSERSNYTNQGERSERSERTDRGLERSGNQERNSGRSYGNYPNNNNNNNNNHSYNNYNQDMEGNERNDRGDRGDRGGERRYRSHNGTYKNEEDDSIAPIGGGVPAGGERRWGGRGRGFRQQGEQSDSNRPEREAWGDRDRGDRGEREHGDYRTRNGWGSGNGIGSRQ